MNKENGKNTFKLIIIQLISNIYKKIPKTTIGSKIQAEKSVLDRIQIRQLKWYGHLLRMEDIRWPKKTPYGWKRRGRPQQ